MKRFTFRIAIALLMFAIGVSIVMVWYDSRDGATEVIIAHERIPDAATRDRHEAGWHGCLEGLASYAGRARP
jgi:hypothetical protein